MFPNQLESTLHRAEDGVIGQYLLSVDEI